LAIQGAGTGTRIAKVGKCTEDAAQEDHMPKDASALDSHSSAKEQVVELYKDVKQEVKFEAHNPLDAAPGDMLVRKHVNGLAITFFILISLSLLVAIVGYALYNH
jgi:hypothetical protein